MFSSKEVEPMISRIPCVLRPQRGVLEGALHLAETGCLGQLKLVGNKMAHTGWLKNRHLSLAAPKTGRLLREDPRQLVPGESPSLTPRWCLPVASSYDGERELWSLYLLLMHTNPSRGSCHETASKLNCFPDAPPPNAITLKLGLQLRILKDKHSVQHTRHQSTLPVAAGPGTLFMLLWLSGLFPHW